MTMLPLINLVLLLVALLAIGVSLFFARRWLADRLRQLDLAQQQHRHDLGDLTAIGRRTEVHVKQIEAALADRQTDQRLQALLNAMDRLEHRIATQHQQLRDTVASLNERLGEPSESESGTSLTEELIAVRQRLVELGEAYHGLEQAVEAKARLPDASAATAEPAGGMPSEAVAVRPAASEDPEDAASPAQLVADLPPGLWHDPLRHLFAEASPQAATDPALAPRVRRLIELAQSLPEPPHDDVENDSPQAGDEFSDAASASGPAIRTARDYWQRFYDLAHRVCGVARHSGPLDRSAAWVRSLLEALGQLQLEPRQHAPPEAWEITPPDDPMPHRPVLVHRPTDRPVSQGRRPRLG